MNSVDALCLIVIAFNLIIGVIRGAVWQVLRLASIAMGIWGAFHYGREFLALFPSSWGLSDGYGLVVAQVVLFLSIYIVMFGVTHVVKAVIDKIKLGSWDRMFGGVLGAAKGVLFCCVALYLQFVPIVGQLDIFKRQLYGDPVAGVERSLANDIFLAHLKHRIESAVPAGVAATFDDHLRKVGRDVATSGR